MNNMLGELDVIGHEPRAAGTRLPTMLTPTLALENGRARLVLGSAGSVRLAGAIAQVAWQVVGGSMPLGRRDRRAEAARRGQTRSISRAVGPRRRYAGLEKSWDVVRWSGRNLYFGGVQAVEVDPSGVLAAAGDPRRGGAGVVVA